MKLNNNYTFNATFNAQYHFQILCSSEPFIIPLCDRWNIISAPFNESIDKNTLLIQNNSIEYNWSQAVSEGIILGFIYNFNRTSQTYEFSDIFEPGYGYWIWSYYPCEILIENITIDDNYITQLQDNWAILGLPFNDIIQKTNITIMNNTVNYSWADAVTNGIILDFVYSWNCTKQVYEFSNYFKPGRGYWMYAYYDCVLRKSI